MVARMVNPAGYGPAAALALLAGTIAAAVGHFLPDGAGWNINKADTRFAKIQTGAAEYPRRAADSDGFSVRIARPVRRIASQHWAIDEYAYSIVPAERVVAVSESAYLQSISNVYAQVQKHRPAIASDPERVLRLDPDLLLVSNSSRADFCALVRAADLPIYRVLTTFTSLAQVAETIRLTGYLTGEDTAATAEIQRFWSEIERAKAKRKPGAAPRILGLGNRYAYGAETIFDDIVRTLGGVNVAARGGLKGYDAVNGEQIVRWNAEWIVAGADRGKTRAVAASLMADPAIAETPAARNGHVLVFDFNVFLPASPFTTLLVNAMAKEMYE
jgi:iron complex transport system substrate-binding protein